MNNEKQEIENIKLRSLLAKASEDIRTLNDEVKFLNKRIGIIKTHTLKVEAYKPTKEIKLSYENKRLKIKNQELIKRAGFWRKQMLDFITKEERTYFDDKLKLKIASKD